MLEHHTNQKNLLVLRRNSKEQEEHHRSQKNQLVPHMSSKERQERHMSLQERQEHHMNLTRLKVRHMSLKAGNQVRMLELAVLYRSLKKKETVLHKSCLQKMVIHRNWRCLLGLDKNLKGLIGRDCFHRSLLPVASCRSR